MIIFGTKGANIQMGDADSRHCPICRESTPHQFLLAYRWFHLYFIMGVVTRRMYSCVCRRCNNGVALNRKDLPPTLAQIDPIPLMQRYGLIIGPAIGLAGAFLICFILLKFVIK